MIFVTVGTNETPFDRLITTALAIAEEHPVLVQYGSSRHTAGPGDWSEFLSFEQMEAGMRTARVVLTHAGVGSILLALQCGRRPVVMPRRHVLGEAVDDHQVVLARRLEASGLVTVAEDVAQVRAALRPSLAVVPARDAVAAAVSVRGLTAELATYLTDRTG